LIGTTDLDHHGDPSEAHCTPEEQAYLIEAASKFMNVTITDTDVVWTYSGVRPLYDDNASSATAATRDYVLTVTDSDARAPLLNVFGGKITTYRRLAESALEKLTPYYAGLPDKWTAGIPLPGGDFPHDGVEDLIARLQHTYGFLDDRNARRLIRAYGTDAFEMLGDAASAADLGQDFGAGVSEAEVRWLIENEWVRSADDLLWRRSKRGLRVTEPQQQVLEAFIAQHVGAGS